MLLAMLHIAFAAGPDPAVARGLEESPEVKAAFHRWQAAMHRVARARSLPEPTVSFGVYVRSVETRVGPQQARISVQQAFPWPTALTRAGQAASSEAGAAEKLLEARSLAVAARVESAWWSVWENVQTQARHREHAEVLVGLSETVRARLQTGSASLADLQQVDLARARLDDRILSLAAVEKTLRAQLSAAVGVREPIGIDADALAPVATLGEPLDTLREAALQHPEVDRWSLEADAAQARTRAVSAGRLPGFTVGADWIVTGPSTVSGMTADESGKDAVMAVVGMKVPLWQHVVAEQSRSHAAEALAARSEHQRQGDVALAGLEEALNLVQDAARRAQTVSGTLLPQAEAAYASVLSGWVVGEARMAQVLLAQRDLLDLRVEGVEARADHQRAWALLEQRVGRDVKRGTENTDE